MSNEMANEPFVTRGDAQAQWGISRSSLIRAEKTCLKADRREHGEVYYARHEVEALATKMRRSLARSESSMDGETLASIFDLLEKHVSPADIVRQTRLHPDVVENVAARWRRMKEVLFTLTWSDVAALLDAIGFADGHPPVGTFAQLLEEVSKHQAALAESPPATATKAATMSLADGAAPALVDLLAELTEEDRNALLSDQSFLSAVDEDLVDLEQGDVNQAQATASIERAKARALKMLRGRERANQKKRPRKTR